MRTKRSIQTKETRRGQRKEQGSHLENESTKLRGERKRKSSEKGGEKKEQTEYLGLLLVGFDDIGDTRLVCSASVNQSFASAKKKPKERKMRTNRKGKGKKGGKLSKP